MSIKNIISQNVKNVVGWKTKRKIVVISADDYGNVRVASREARERLDKAGLKNFVPFDKYDSLENEEDLLALYDTLNSVKDKNGNPAVITAYSVPANINFEKMIESGYSEYHYELLPETYSKLPGYQNVHALWKEGISNKLLVPQFHGREHLNLKVLMHLLNQKDKEVMACFANRSYTSISSKPFPTIGYTAAFDFYDFKENEGFKDIITDGLNQFEKVFGYRAEYFNPPAAKFSSSLHETLSRNGIKYMDAARFHSEHLGSGKYKRKYYYTGKKNSSGITFMVKNCVFEPVNNPSMDWSQFCLNQIETAFKWNAPANIGTHRINFCGNVEPENRKNGLTHLKNLLKKIVAKWPDVEFMTSVELMDLVSKH